MTSPLDQKLKIAGPSVITANRLSDGAVVYRAANGRWTTQFEQAEVVTTAPAAAQLLASANAEGLTAVGAYVAPVQREPTGAMRPGNLRELIRLNGPTIALPGL